MDKEVTINEEQKLYVIPSGKGYSCLGFDVCQRWTMLIAQELDRKDLLPIKSEHGTLEAYKRYERASTAAMESGKRLNCMLTPELIGLEKRRVEVIDCYGETRRFYVGKSTGILPIHLEISRRNSLGGPGAMGTPYKSVRIIQ